MASNVLTGTAAASHLDGSSAERISGIQTCVAPSSGEITASIVRLTDAFPDLHEHSAAQVSFLFRGTGAAFVTPSPARGLIHTPLQTGSAVYIAPEQRHRVHWHGSGEMLNLYFPENLLREVTKQTGCELPDKSMLRSADPTLRGISQGIRDEFSSDGGVAHSIIEHARFLVVARLTRLLISESSRPTVGLLSTQRLQPAIDAMNTFPERHFDLAELARLCNSSLFHFARSFTSRLGTPPSAYQRTLRLQKAQSLLHDTDLSTEAIAYAVGIGTPTNFSRMFRRYTGYSPKEFRRLASPSRRSFHPSH